MNQSTVRQLTHCNVLQMVKEAFILMVSTCMFYTLILNTTIENRNSFHLCINLQGHRFAPKEAHQLTFISPSHKIKTFKTSYFFKIKIKTSLIKYFLVLNKNFVTIWWSWKDRFEKNSSIGNSHAGMVPSCNSQHKALHEAFLQYIPDFLKHTWVHGVPLLSW